ncbi:MAG: Uma2 family endonuclease [Acidobacteriota bacterium]|nr:Uma2 family endonuclease [Acidobacteriota bacterium]
MAATATVPIELTLDEYLHSTYHPDCDFVDGHIEERHLGEYEHSILQAEIASWFIQRRKEWTIRVTTEYRTRVTPTRIRIPDVSIFPAGGPIEKVRTTPPLLAIEILSPEDRLPRVLTRLNDFLTMGVPNLWLIDPSAADPSARSAFIYSATGLQLVEAPRLTIANSPIYLDLPEIFSALD